jgi:hypothetical protein
MNSQVAAELFVNDDNALSPQPGSERIRLYCVIPDAKKQTTIRRPDVPAADRSWLDDANAVVAGDAGHELRGRPASAVTESATHTI